MTRGKLVLRPYRPDDLPAIFAVEDQCFFGAFRFSRKELQGYIEAKTAITLIAEERETLAGFAIVDLQLDRDVAIGYLQTIDVAPAYRDRGIATALLTQIEHNIAQQGGRAVMLHVSVLNQPAIALYEKRGYSKWKLHENFYGDAGDAFLYWKTVR